MSIDNMMLPPLIRDLNPYNQPAVRTANNAINRTCRTFIQMRDQIKQVGPGIKTFIADGMIENLKNAEAQTNELMEVHTLYAMAGHGYNGKEVADKKAFDDLLDRYRKGAAKYEKVSNTHQPPAGGNLEQ